MTFVAYRAYMSDIRGRSTKFSSQKRHGLGFTPELVSRLASTTSPQPISGGALVPRSEQAMLGDGARTTAGAGRERDAPSRKQFLSRIQRTRIPSARSNGRPLDAEVPHVCRQLPAGKTMRVANASTRQGFKLGR
ncbi:hypothetical protein AOLI_G00220210 [Acnodon oligacanthus]